MSTKEKTPKKFDFKIGADPEFSIILQNKRIDACQTMKGILTGKKEFKETSMTNSGYNVGKFGNIGWDGASQTAEIRPNPSNVPNEVITNIGGLLHAFGKYMSIFELTTLSQHASIGGHIHFEAKPDWSTQKQKMIHAQMISFYMPILMSENKINLSLRIRQGYGAMRDFRFDNHHSTLPDQPVARTYEFRCPSAEWLTSPKIAEAVIAYLGVVYNEIINHPKNLKKCNKILLKSEEQTNAFQTLAIQEFDLLTGEMLKNIKKYIKTFALYETFKEEIEFILHPQQVIKEKTKFNYDINNGWSLSDLHKVTKREITSEKKFNAKLKDKDADTISKMLHIDYNDDAKVNEFVNALSLRAGAFNWKLSKQYFVFGLKKGIKEIIVKNMQNDYLTGTKQIKTRNDYSLIERAFEKMILKYSQTGSVPNLMTVDFKTGKPISLRNNMIFIGLPYDMRIEGKTKAFIDMIWQIENNKLSKTEIHPDQLTTEMGEIEKAKQEKEEVPEAIPENAIRIDPGNSTSSRNQQNAIEDMQNEIRIRESNHSTVEEMDSSIEEMITADNAPQIHIDSSPLRGSLSVNPE